MQCPVLLWVWQQFELVCDDTVLMMPPSLSHYSLEGEDQGRDEKVVNGLLGYRDDEVM